MFIWKLIELKLCNKIKSSVLIVKNFVDIQGVPRNMIVNRRLKGRLRSLKILTNLSIYFFMLDSSNNTKYL